jgi:hypothetical protein
VKRKFEVIITRDCTESAVVIVEAENEVEAGMEACRLGKEDTTIDWEIDDNLPDMVYIGGMDCIEEVLEEN